MSGPYPGPRRCASCEELAEYAVVTIRPGREIRVLSVVTVIPREIRVLFVCTLHATYTRSADGAVMELEVYDAIQRMGAQDQ